MDRGFFLFFFFSVFYLLDSRTVEFKQPKGKQMADSFIPPCTCCPAWAQQALGSSGAR